MSTMTIDTTDHIGNAVRAADRAQASARRGDTLGMILHRGVCAVAVQLVMRNVGGYADPNRVGFAEDIARKMCVLGADPAERLDYLMGWAE